MENILFLLTFMFFVIVTPSLQSFFDNFAPRNARLCRNGSANLFFVDLDIQLVPIIGVHPGTGQLSLLVEASWTTDFSHERLPDHVPLDGFLVHFMKTDDKRNFSNPSDSLLPTSPCISGRDNAWVRTSDSEICDDDDVEEDCRQMYPEFCLCPVGNCSLIEKDGCKSTDYFLQEYDVHYLTIPSTERKLVFSVEFHVKYEFDIAPYNREFANRGGETDTIEVIECPNVYDNTTYTQDEITQFCCLNGFEGVIAYNITASEPRPVFAKDANATTLNITFTWFPPGDGEAVHTFFIFIQDTDQTHSPDRSDFRMIPYDPPSNAINSSACKIPKYYYEMEVYNVKPRTEYTISITTSFNDSLIKSTCEGLLCTASRTFIEEVPADICKEEFGLCHPNATCANVFDPSTGRDATCECQRGLEGHGLRDDPGQETGCTETNDCQTVRNECDDLADCTDLLAPEIGVKCHCMDGYYGDGRETGSGCRSSRETALAISLPILAVVIIIAGVIAWYIVRERRRRYEELFQKYVATDNGILMHLNHGADEEKGPWEPTFGPKWEIDRKIITFGKVLGRGHYGVVHLAWLSKDDDEAIQDGNSSFRNGDFYNPVSSQETDEDRYEKVGTNSSVVAVKSLQESTQNRKNLANFLEEIGFMLNIAEHKNILRIYGCTTTEEPVYMITEYMAYGDLLHFLWDAREISEEKIDPVYKVTEESLCGMAADVANAMAYLEQIKIIHGDIAARNILVGEKGICKLSDFGLANDVYRYGWSKGDKEQLVPYKWISPERMMSGQKRITGKSDVWSFGNLMYEMFTLGCPPHPGVEASELLQLLKTGYRMRKPNSCNDQIYDLMNKCWRWTSWRRPTFEELLKLLKTLGQNMQSRSQVNMTTAVEELDREEYANELMKGLQEKKNDYVNGNITVVENECDKQTRGM